MYDVIVVGGGPAGLNAALVLGRARRRTLVCDSGRYRNASSRALHGFLTRDGVAPSELRDIARSELARYTSVEIREEAVSDVAFDPHRSCFVAIFGDGARALGRKLVIATGVVDELPPLRGVEAAYGRTVFHCPYCDGWEVRDAPLAVYGRGDHKGAGLALELTLWSKRIVLCSDGPAEITPPYAERLARFGIMVHEERIAALEGERESLRIVFANGSTLDRRAMFFNTTRTQGSDFARRLGCTNWGVEGCRLDSKVGKTNVHGLYVVGDASRDVLQAVVAAAEGAEAAVAINTELLHDDGVLG